MDSDHTMVYSKFLKLNMEVLKKKKIKLADDLKSKKIARRKREKMARD
jgi:hypothetical protein